jgi:hypothetical protein
MYETINKDSSSYIVPERVGLLGFRTEVLSATEGDSNSVMVRFWGAQRTDSGYGVGLFSDSLLGVPLTEEARVLCQARGLLGLLISCIVHVRRQFPRCRIPRISMGLDPEAGFDQWLVIEVETPSTPEEVDLQYDQYLRAALASMGSDYAGAVRLSINLTG